MDRVRKYIEGARVLWSQRRLAVRVAAAVRNGHPNWIGDILGEELPDQDRRVILARMMSHEQMLVDFERDGVRWLTDTGGVGETLFRFGSFEPEKEAAVIVWLARRGTVIDVGANLGTTTLAFAAAGFDVIAVEAVPSTFEMLCANVERNGYAEQVRCVQAAIAETDTVEMWSAETSGQSEIAMTRHESVIGERVTVPGVALTDVVDGDVTLVWADVQGAETGVLRTGRELWAADVPAFLEVDPRLLADRGGVDAFVAEAHAFTAFTPWDDLAGGRGPRPISDLAAWVAGLDSFSDALFETDGARRIDRK